MTNDQTTPEPDEEGEVDVQNRRDEHTTDSNRRRFLLGVGAATALVAGCVSQDDDGGTGDDGGSDDGSDDGTDDGSDDGTDDGSDDGTDDGSDDGTDDGTDDGSDDGTDDGTDDGGDNGDGEPPSDEELAQQFAQTMSWDGDDNWRMVWTDDSEGITGEYHYHGSDFYIRVESPDGTAEWYLVDDTYYFVAEGQCFEFDSGFSTVPDPEEGGAQDAEEEFSNPDPDDIPEIEKCGTDTIDGDPVTCWEVTTPSGDVARYYLLDSGYPRRIEVVNQDVVIDFFDWGSTEPISPPDMDCQSPYGG